MTSVLAQAATEGAFRPALRLDELAEVHIPFRQLGFDVEPERLVLDGVAQHTGLTLLTGAPGNGKSSLLAYLAEQMAASSEPSGRLYLPLFVPVAPRAEDAMSLRAFGSMAIGNLLAGFEELSDAEERALERLTADQVAREAPSRTLNARLSAKLFGVGIEGGAESRGEVVTITQTGAALDEFGGLPTLAHTLRGRNRELVVIVEDTDGWTLHDVEHQGRDLARKFFSRVLAPLATSDLSIVVALQTHWTREVEEFQLLKERIVKEVALPSFGDGTRALDTVRSVLTRRLQWKLGGTYNAADVVTDSALKTLADELRRSESIRSVLTLMRLALDQLEGRYPDRLDTEHLVETV